MKKYVFQEKINFKLFLFLKTKQITSFVKLFVHIQLAKNAQFMCLAQISYISTHIITAIIIIKTRMVLSHYNIYLEIINMKYMCKIISICVRLNYVIFMLLNNTTNVTSYFYKFAIMMNI